MTYYVSLMALTVFYFFGSFASVLPWSVCNPDSQINCISKDDNITALGLNASTVVSSADAYFK